MPTFGHGKSSVVLANGVNFSNYLNSIETPMEVDTAETTVFNSSGAKSYIPGLKDATLSAEGFYDGSSGSVDSILTSVLGASTPIVWTWYPQGTAAGNYGYGMQTIETSYSLSSPVDEVVTISVEGQSKSGGRDRVESLLALTAETTSGNGSSDDNAAATTNGGVGYFQRTDNSTKGVTPVIQHSSAATSWATLVAFSSGTAKGGQRIAVAGSVKRYTRASWTITGSTLVSTTLHFGFNRR